MTTGERFLFTRYLVGFTHSSPIDTRSTALLTRLQASFTRAQPANTRGTEFIGNLKRTSIEGYPFHVLIIYKILSGLHPYFFGDIVEALLQHFEFAILHQS